MKRLIAGLCVLLMSMGGGVALAESAAAWSKPTVSGSGTCENGAPAVTWTVTNTETGFKNSHARISKSSRPEVVEVGTKIGPGKSKTFTEKLAPGETVKLQVSLKWTGEDGSDELESNEAPATAPEDCGQKPAHEKITYCHSGNGKHYGIKTTSEAAFYKHGHVDHPYDIYPAGEYKGSTWEAQGDQSLLASGCVKPDELQRETRDRVKADCVTGVAVVRHQERTRTGKHKWSKWKTVKTETRDVTLEQCPVADQTETRSRDTGTDCASGKVTFVEEQRTRSAVEWADGKPVFGDWSDWTQTRVGTRQATEAELRACPVTEEPPTDEPPAAKPPVKHEAPAAPVQEAAPVKPPMTPVAVSTLPRTGIEAGPLAGIAAGLVLLGAGALVVARRKRG